MGSIGSLTELRDQNVEIVVLGPALKQIDEMNVVNLGQQLVEIADRLPQPLLILDMSETEFFGSSFIEVLFRVWKKLSVKPMAHLGIAGLQPYCREVIAVTHLDTLWQIFDTHAAGSEAFNNDFSARTGE